MIITTRSIEEITKRIDAGIEPDASVFSRLTTAADEALKQKPLSIMDCTHSHLFKVNVSYLPGQDGVRSPREKLDAGIIAGALSQKVELLVAAWRFTGHEAYADKALELINTWCINQDTYMAPIGHIYEPSDPKVKPNGDITLFACFNSLFMAAHQLDGYVGWGGQIKQALKRWVRAMVEANRHPMFYQGYPMYNNWEDARLLYLSKGALFLGDDHLLAEVFVRWKEIIPEKMTASGMLTREAERTRSLHYHLFSLHSTIQVATLAEGLGEGLFEYESEGKCLKLAIDYVCRHLLKPETWPHPMIEPLDSCRDRILIGQTFELAYAYWGDAAYLNIIRKYDARNYEGNYLTLLAGCFRTSCW